MKVRGRREWLRTVALAGFGAAGARFLGNSHVQARSQPWKEATQTAQPLLLKDYQPKSMLHVPGTQVPRSRFPNIDFHTHLSWIDRKGTTDVVRHTATPGEVLQVMDAKNIRTMINLTGGYGTLLQETISH